ncbi:class I SAM-dependent methyltransferase [Labrys neptuniae]
MTSELAQHWDNAYASKGDRGVSWFEESPDFSLELIERLAAKPPFAVIDIGGGASRLVDAGLARGWRMAVLDLSPEALETARLGPRAGEVEWHAADIRTWRPAHPYDLWHDRAALHFLVEAKHREAYVERLRAALKPGGHAVIATFAPDGPERCSGLPVRRYDAALLGNTLGPSFRLISEHRRLHTTPWGSAQSFQFSVFRREGTG